MAIRYSKGGEDMFGSMDDRTPLTLGSWEELVAGEEAEILAVGRMVKTALNASMILAGQGIACGVTDARFVKPMDDRLLRDIATHRRLIVTLEDNAAAGGFGSAVLEKLSAWGIGTPILLIGLPDRFVEQATVEEQTEECGLTAEQVANSVKKRLNSH